MPSIMPCHTITCLAAMLVAMPQSAQQQILERVRDPADIAVTRLATLRPKVFSDL